MSLGHNDRHRRVLIGKPVRSVERIIDLRLRVSLGASGHVLQGETVERPDTRRNRISPAQIVAESDGGNEQKKNGCGKGTHAERG